MLEHYLLLGVVAVAAVVALSSAGARLGVAPPLVLIGVGIVYSLLPIVEDIRVPGEVLLIAVLPPLLYASAVSVPVVEFRRDLMGVGALAVVLVVGTAVVLGLILRAFLPDVPLMTCVALGAIISPTDAVATTIVKRLRAPSRVVTLLDGESLLNDATALVLLRATTAGGAASLSFVDVGRDFVVSALVATVVGLLVGWLSVRVRARVHIPPANTAISFIVPFVAYGPAEGLGASGLVAVVVAGLVSNLLAPHRLAARYRLNEEANWRTVEFLLEGAVFLVMGLQIKALVHDAQADGSSLGLAVGLGFLAILGTLAVRAVFVTGLGLVLKRVTQRKVRRKERWETMGEALGVDVSDPDSWSAADVTVVRLATRPVVPPGLGNLAQSTEQRRRALEARLRGGQGLSSAIRAVGGGWAGSRDPSDTGPIHAGGWAGSRSRRRPTGGVHGGAGVASSGGVHGGAGVASSGGVHGGAGAGASGGGRWGAGTGASGGGRWGAGVGGAGRRDRARREKLIARMKESVQRYVADLNYLLREPLGLKEGSLLVWAGMRGAVTLAAAQSLSGRVAHAPLLILIAFTAAAGSLLIQGGTLRRVATALGLAGLDAVPEGERAALDQALGEAAIAALHDPDLCQPDGEPYDPGIIALVTLRIGVTRLAETPDDADPVNADPDIADPDIADPDPHNDRPDDAPGPAPPPAPTGLAETLRQARRRITADDDDVGDEATLDTAARKRQHRELRLVTLVAMREALLEARALGAYSHTTLSDALAVLDSEEFSLELRARTLD